MNPHHRRNVAQHVLIGIVVAMPEEAAYLLGHEHPSSRMIGQTSFYIPAIMDRSVVVAVSGMGKANAAIATALLVSKFNVTAVMSVGCAGDLSGTLPDGPCLIDKVITHDYGLSSPTGTIPHHPGMFPHPDQEGSNRPTPIAHADLLLKGQLERLALPHATLASGDLFVNDDVTRSWLRKWGADLVDMEMSGVLQAADAFNIPWIGIKGKTDDANGSSHSDFRVALHQTMERVAFATRQAVELLN